MGTNKSIPAGGQVHTGNSRPELTDDLRQISTLAGILIWEADPETRSLSWLSGPSTIKELPLLESLDDYIGLNHPDDRDATRDAFRQWLDGVQPLDIQHRILLPSGSSVWLHSRGAIRSADQTRMLGVAQDITGYRQRQADVDLLATIQNYLETNADDDRMLHEVGALLCEHLDLASITFIEIPESGDQMTLLHEYLNVDALAIKPGTQRPRSDFIPPEIEEALSRGIPVAIDDAAEDPRLAAQRHNFETIGLRSVLYIPYVQEGRWAMLLCANRRYPQVWQQHEREFLAEVSERVSLRLDRSRAHLGLQQSEDRYRSLFESMDEGFCIIEMIYNDAGDPVDYRFITVNPAFERHTTMRNAAGKRMKEIIPTHEDHWFETYGKVDRTRTPVRFTNEAKGLDGRWFDLSAFPIGTPSQHHVAVLFTDITDRMRTEQSLREFESRVQRALKVESVGIIFFKPEGPVTYANSAFLRMSGYTSEDVANGRVRWDSMTPQEWMPSARRAITEFMSFGRITPYEKEYIRKDGSRWWGLFAASRIDANEGVKFIVDISAMKQAEMERDRLAGMVEDSNDAIIRCDPDGEIVDVNRATLELYGYARDEIIGKNIMDTAPPDRRDEFSEKYARLLCGEHIPPWETVRQRKDGTQLQVDIRMSPIRDASGEIVGCSGIVRDVSERKRLEQAQEDFLAMASHDLKSPVTVLLGRAQLMRRRQTYDDNSIRTIIDQARRIERLATDLQHVVHIESGKMEFHPGQIDLIPLVREAVDRLRPSASGFEFNTELPEAPVVGSWDRIRIAQVIDNLLTNAVKYSPDGGTISVCVIPDDSDVELRITDQGVGINADLQKRLFSRFYRADLNGVSSGLGLGLYISRMLIEAHGGTISVTSTPGQGSTFTVCLPRNLTNNEQDVHAPS